jgi:hypothetical protein
MAIRMTSKGGCIFPSSYFACDPDGCRGNTEQVVIRWWCPEASNKALDMLHWEMLLVPLQRVSLVFKMASGRGTFLLLLPLLFDKS